MRKRAYSICLFLFLSGLLSAAPFSLLTWNIQDLGGTKDEEELLQIAEIMRDYDIIAIQEVVAKDPAGAKAIAKLVDKLNRMGDSWDYRVSDPTQSPSAYLSERYAFIWKASKIQMIGRPFLEIRLKTVCIREPFVGKFREKESGLDFYVVNFHSRRHDEKPEKEIQHFHQFQEWFESEYVFIAGDFNLDELHPVWNTLYGMGFQPTLLDSPTTLKRKCTRGKYLNHAIDNIYFDGDVISLLQAGKVDFVKECRHLADSRTLSDHLPVFLECELK